MKFIAFLLLFFFCINATGQRLLVHVVTYGCNCMIQKLDSTGKPFGKMVQTTTDTTRLAVNGFYKGIRITCDSISKNYPFFYELSEMIIEANFNCKKEIRKRYYKNFPGNIHNRYLTNTGSVYGLSFEFRQAADVNHFFYYVAHKFNTADLRDIYANLPKYKPQVIDNDFLSVEGDLIFTYSQDNKIFFNYHTKWKSRRKIYYLSIQATVGNQTTVVTKYCICISIG